MIGKLAASAPPVSLRAKRSNPFVQVNGHRDCVTPVARALGGGRVSSHREDALRHYCRRLSASQVFGAVIAYAASRAVRLTNVPILRTRGSVPSKGPRPHFGRCRRRMTRLPTRWWNDRGVRTREARVDRGNNIRPIRPALPPSAPAAARATASPAHRRRRLSGPWRHRTACR